MNSKTKYITVFLLISNLLIAHIGVSLEWIYCACKGETEVSFFHIEEHCAKTETDDCCQKEAKEEANIKPCCRKFQKLEQEINAKKTHDCTTKGKTYVKADLKFTALEKTDLKHFDFAVTPFLFLQNTDNQCFVTQKNYFSFPNNKAPPPRPYNRELLVLIQSFLC